MEMQPTSMPLLEPEGGGVQAAVIVDPDDDITPERNGILNSPRGRGTQIARMFAVSPATASEPE